MAAPKVLVVFPASLFGGEWAAGPRVKPELVSVWSHLQRTGAEVSVLDLEVELGNPTPDDVRTWVTRAEDAIDAVVDRVLNEPAADTGLVAFACLSPLQYGATRALAESLRRSRPAVVIAVFGHHATVRPDDFIDGASAGVFDWVVQGEAEVSLAEIAADAASAGREPGACRVGVGGPLPLDAASVPDYAGYPYTRPGLPGIGVYLSRGCQYHSAACYAGPGGGAWRAYPADVAFDLIASLDSLRPDEVEVLDPTFGFDGGWRRTVLARLAGIDRRPVPLSISARPESFTRADIDAVYGGRLHLHLNVGTLSPSLLSTLDVAGPRRRVESTLELLNYANAKGVPAEVDLVFGQPGETRATAAETLDALESLLASFPNTSLRLAASPWVYEPFAAPEVDLEAPAVRFGTRVAHGEWWREDSDSFPLARAVVPSHELADLEPGDDAYWRPRFDEIGAAFAAKLTAEARRNLRSHESVGSAAEDVPHGFWREPRWR